MSDPYPLHGGTVDQLRRQLADARRAEQITAQLLDEARKELSRKGPMADAGHAYCAAYRDMVTGFDLEGVIRLHDALLAAPRASTPSPGPATHVVVEVVELDRLERRALNSQTEAAEALADAVEDFAFAAEKDLDKLRAAWQAYVDIVDTP